MTKNRSARIEELLSGGSKHVEPWVFLRCEKCRTDFFRIHVEAQEWTRGPGAPDVCFDCFVKTVTGKTDVVRFIVGAGSEFAFAALTVNPEKGEYEYLVRDMGIDRF